MKLLEIFSGAEQQELLLKVLKAHGYQASHCAYRSHFHKGQTVSAVSVHMENVRGNFIAVYFYYDEDFDHWCAERVLPRGYKFGQFDTPEELLDYLEYLKNPYKRKKVEEARAPKRQEPALPPAKPEDIEAVREAVGFLFAVQKRLEKLDELYADPDSYGGIGIYSHYISFRWFGGGGERIPATEKQAIRKIVKEERAKRKQLQRFLSDTVQFDEGEGGIEVPWYKVWASGNSPEWDAAWKAAGMKHVDYEDMVGDIHALAESHKFVSDEDAEQVEFELGLLKRFLLKQLPGDSITMGSGTNGGSLTVVHNLKHFFIEHHLSEMGKIMGTPPGHYRVSWYVEKKPKEKTFPTIEDVVAHIKKVAK
jgi:hypothetical protein